MVRVDRILVPQGIEYQAVCRGVKLANNTQTKVVPIPMGNEALATYLKSGQVPLAPAQQILLMGLCGSLSPAWNLGETVLYKNCTNAATSAQRDCDRVLTAFLHQRLQVPLVQGLTCDHFIYSSAHKQRLGQDYRADVVDMEGFTALELSQAGIAVAMVRVVSDDCYQNLPDLNPAIAADGALHLVPLTVNLLKQPKGAARLIWGSIRGLRKLQQVTTRLLS